MKKLLALCGLVALVGCSTVEITPVGSLPGGKRLLVVQADSFQLVRYVPLVTNGLVWDSAKKDVDPSPIFFENQSDTQHLYQMARKIAERENCDLEDVTFIDKYTDLNISFAPPWGLITCNDTTISAVLAPRVAKSGK